TMCAILREDPPPAQGALADVVNRLLRRNREDRYTSADAVLEALNRPATSLSPASKLTRLIVLPFHILRPHEPSDFLAFSLPDAITTSLAGVDSLVVRSTMAAGNLAASQPYDIQAIATQAQVDAILTGTILANGDRLRVNTQLVQAPDG